MENMSSILFMRDLMILQFRYKKRTHSNNVLLTFTSVLQLQCFAPVQQFISFIWSLFLYHVTFIETRHAHGFHYSLCHTVNDLVHWRDPKKSGVVFGVSLLLLLSLAAFSVISVVSYLLLALLCVTISFRIYKSVIQAVQKSSEGHPFK